MRIYADGNIEVYGMRACGELPRGERERAAVERLLAEAFGGKAPELRHLPSGAPVLVEGGASVSVTHCREFVAVAIAADGRRIGIDAESRGRGGQLRRVAHKFLSAEQMPQWSLDEAALLRGWTVKEAIYKAMLTPGLPLAGIPLPATSAALEEGKAVALQCGGVEMAVKALVAEGFDGALTLAMEPAAEIY